MTGLIKETLTEQADGVTEPSLDLDAVMRTGDRRIRRHKVATVLTVAAASVAVLAGGITVVKVTGDEPVQPAGQPMNFTERRPTYAANGTIHFGSETIGVGKDQISAFAQTDAGFVYVTSDGTVKATNGRRTEQIGTGNSTRRLAVDDRGPLVGWVDSTRPTPEFVLYDVAARREVTRTSEGNRPGTPAPNDDPVQVSAIDDGTAYFGANDGLRRWNVAEGKGQLIKPGAKPTLLHAVSAGQLVWERDQGDKPSDLASGTDINTSRPRTYQGWTVNVSPGGRFMMTDIADEVRLYFLESGRQLPLKFDGYMLIGPTQWQGDGTFYAVGFKDGTTPVDLLTCSTSALTCDLTKAAIAPSPTDKVEFQVPVGFPIDE
ncbi:hypothetical protein [Kribbella sp. DT2]|uniref:hypothetical protein n=1 Tax=Kribbella sp. DT2 TaxID=3393427 RepID=UPI003CF56B44